MPTSMRSFRWSLTPTPIWTTTPATGPTRSRTTLAPAPPEADVQLRLLLNSLYMIGEKRLPLRQIKVIYELRTMSKAGYQPDLLSCSSCGKYEGGEFYLDPVEGNLLCAECADKARHIPNLDPGALFALRHVCLVDDKRIFGFRISAESQETLAALAERYALTHLDKPLKSYDFF